MENLAQQALARARQGHFEWEMARRPDVLASLDRPAMEVAHWVAVDVVLQPAAAAPPDLAALKRWLAVLESAAIGALFGAFEAERLAADLGSGRALRLTLLLERARLDALTGAGLPDFAVLVQAIGAPFLPDAISWPVGWLPKTITMAMPAAPVSDDPAVAAPPETGPLVGIIDDGIACLNKRFCRRVGTGLRTRFEAVWLQSELLGPAPSGRLEVPFGAVLERADLDRQLAGGQPEAQLYRSLNAALYPLPSQQATNTNCHPTKTPGTSDRNREQLGIADNRR